MAAITLTAVSGNNFKKTAESIVDAETDTYWLVRPHFARFAQIFFTIETLVGTSLQLRLRTVPPYERDDDHVILLREAAAFAALTSADVTSVVDIGPGVTGIADDVTGGAAADSWASINCILPDILGIDVISVGTGTNVYDLNVTFRP